MVNSDRAIGIIGDTQARWSSDEPNSYARVFGYDEEGRLVKIERDYGGGDVQVAYEYGYNTMVFGYGSEMCGTGRSIGIYAE